MNPAVTPQESRRFIKIFLVVSGAWLLLGLIIHWINAIDVYPFLNVFILSFLDLLCLILLFWYLFFNQNRNLPQSVKNVRILFLFLFKLVCLGFLAITLKRLRNASPLSLFFGVSVVWISPLISAFLARNISKLKSL